MDLSAAVDGTYLVQLTNNGLYVLNKTSSALATPPTSLYNFWCGKGVLGVNGLPLADCPAAQSTIITDVQIAHTSVYPGGRWVATTMSPDKTYLWLAFSKTNDPTQGWYRWSFQGCLDFSTSYTYMDQPILGVSSNMPGGPGRLIVDMKCYSSSSEPASSDGPDDIYDFALNPLNNGHDITAPPKTFCTDPSASCAATGLPPTTGPLPFLIRLRPVNHNIDYSGRGVFLSTVYFSSTSDCTAGQSEPQCGTPELYVYGLKLSSTVTGDSLVNYLGTGTGNFFTMTGLTVQAVFTPLVAQTEKSDLLPIFIDELHTDNGDVIRNDQDGDNYFVASFTALAPDATVANGVYTSGDSYYVAFVLNLTSGKFVKFVSSQLGGIASYSNAVIDSDDEVWVNYTLFPFSSPPFVNEDEYDYYPVSGPPGYIDTYAFAGTPSGDPVQSNGIQYACNPSDTPPRCRWGDYVAQVIDPSCDAFNAGKTPECGLVWGTSEYVYTPTSAPTNASSCSANSECQASQVIAMYDDSTSDDTNGIQFIGYTNTESECVGGGTCYLSISPPAGVEPGDALLVALEASAATQYLPGLPPFWNALGFKNQGGSQNFNSYMQGAPYPVTGWLLTYVYGTLGSGEPSQYTFSEPVLNGGELMGLMLAYRGVATPNVASFLAKGWGAPQSSPSTNLTVTTGTITALADEKLVTILGQGGDEIDGSEFGGDMYFTAPSGLNTVTPTTLSGDVLTAIAAQIGTGSGGTLGPYSSTFSASGSSGGAGPPLAWMVLLPSE